MAPRDRVVRPQALLGGLGKLLRGDPAKKTQERLQPIVDQVNALESGMQSKTDEELRELTKDLQKRAQSGTSLDSLLPEAFAVRGTFFVSSRTQAPCVIALTVPFPQNSND